MIIGWVKCDVCHRRVHVTPFTIKGVTLNLCPYCSIILSSYTQQVRRSRVEPDEEVIRRFSGKTKIRRGV